MRSAGKKAERDRRTRAYRDLVKSLAGIYEVHRPTVANIFDCVTKAHLSERNGVSSILSREVLFQEDSQASVPDELSDQAIARHFASAGELYGSAAVDCVLTRQPIRAFKYFRKAAGYTARAARLYIPCDEKLAQKAREYGERAATIRQEVARKTLLRKKLSLGFLGRLR